MFCGNGPVTNEHVWPDWILELLKKEIKKTYGLKKFWVKVGFNEQTRMTDKFDETVKRVCGPCNREWMNDLENSVKPFLQRMILGQGRVDLLPDDQIKLASWAFKTSLMIDFMLRTNEFPRELATKFYKTRAPVGACFIWSGAYNGREHGFNAIGRPFYVDVNGDLIPGVKLTFRLRTAAFQLFWLSRMTGQYASVQYHPAWHQLWPPKGEALNWPPNNNAFNDEQYTGQANSAHGIIFGPTGTDE